MITVKKNGSAKISLKKLLEYRSMGTIYDFGLMSELRNNGAPIKGVFNPVPDLDNYNWQTEEISYWGNSERYIHIKWREKK